MQTLIESSDVVEKDFPLLAERVKRHRDAAGLSQQELAFRSGLSLSVIAGIEQGKKGDPRLSTVAAIAEALGVPVDGLIAPEKKRRGATRKEK
jgi:transcriptional regulator with XRE-family HTH domain